MQTHTRRDVIKTAAAAAAVVGVAGPVAACGSTSTSKSGAAVGKQTPGGTLRAGISGSSASDSLDPTFTFDTPDYGRAANIFDPLVGQDAQGRPTLMLAKELTPNKDGTEWTLRLRSGITFQDGKPLTADDVIYTLKRILDKKKPGAALPAFQSIDVNGLRKRDSLTLAIPCHTPFATLIQAFAISSFSSIVPVGFDPKKPVGTGPFKLGSFTPNQETVLLKNPNYWIEGRPFADKVIMQAFADPVSQLNALLAGQVDLIDGVGPQAVNQVKSAGKQVVVSESGGYIPIAMRTDQAPFNDVRVRQAMRLLINRQQVLNLVFGGRGTIGNDVFGLLAPEYDHSLPQRTQDIEQAKSLLKAAGQSDMRVVLATANIGQGANETSAVIAQQASDAGVKVQLKTVSTTDFFNVYPKGHSFYVSTFFNDYYLPNASFATITGATYPETGFSNPKYDALYKQAVAQIDESKRAEIAHEMQQIDYNQGGYIIAGFTPLTDAAGANVRGLVPTKSGLQLNGYQFADISVA